MQGKIIYDENGNIKEVYGYKLFSEDLKGYNDFQFEIGKQYHISSIQAKSSGFHFALRLEDTLRYQFKEQEPRICLVHGFGEIVSFDDDYYGYDNLYASTDIEIIKEVSRKEIIAYYESIKDNPYYTREHQRFCQLYPLTDEERSLLKRTRRPHCR